MLGIFAKPLQVYTCFNGKGNAFSDMSWRSLVTIELIRSLASSKRMFSRLPMVAQVGKVYKVLCFGENMKSATICLVFKNIFLPLQRKNKQLQLL